MGMTLLLHAALLVIAFQGVMGDAAASHLRKKKINGVHLRAIAFHYPPIFTVEKTPDGNYSYGGYSYAIQRLVSDFFGVTFSMVPVNLERVRNLGIASALMEKLTNDEADFSAFGFEITLTTMMHLQVMYPIAFVDFTLLQPWPEEQSRLLAPIQPFTSQVWMAIIGATAVFVSFMTILGMVQNRQIHRATKAGREAPAGLHIMLKDSRRVKAVHEVILDQIGYVVNIAMNQGNYIRYSSRTGIRLVLSAWLLSMVVIVYAYTGVLTAYLTVQKLEPTVDTFEQLASSNCRFRITVEKDTLFSNQIMNASSAPYKKFRNLILDDPSLLVSDRFQIMDNVINHRCVYPGSLDLAFAIIKADVEKNGKCRLTIPTKKLDNYISFQAGMQKGNPYSDIIDNFLFIRMWDHGLFSYLKRQHLPQDNYCRVDAPKKEIAKPISLVDLSAPFFILGAGITLSGLLFLAENIYFILARKRSREKMGPA